MSPHCGRVCEDHDGFHPGPREGCGCELEQRRVQDAWITAATGIRDTSDAFGEIVWPDA